MRITLRARRWTLALSMAWIAAGCGSSIVGDDPETGLSILVRRGPIIPVVMEGVENTEPVSDATVRIRGLAGGGSLETRTGGDGTVQVALVPGPYEVEVTDCPGALALPAKENAQVADGSMEEVVLDCDTGIR